MKQCDCGSVKLKHEVKEGRVLPPKGYKPTHKRRFTSWKGIWDIYTCEECDKEYNKLRRE